MTYTCKQYRYELTFQNHYCDEKAVFFPFYFKSSCRVLVNFDLLLGRLFLVAEFASTNLRGVVHFLATRL